MWVIPFICGVSLALRMQSLMRMARAKATVGSTSLASLRCRVESRVSSST